jgi:DNA-binding MarR family transcriptional regulator
MKVDYITASTPLPPHLVFPRFLLDMNVRFTAKEVYAILLDMTLNSEAAQTDQQGRRHLEFFNKTVAELIDCTPSTVAQSLCELEAAGLVEKKLMARNAPYRIYVKLLLLKNNLEKRCRKW